MAKLTSTDIFGELKVTGRIKGSLHATSNSFLNALLCSNPDRTDNSDGDTWIYADSKANETNKYGIFHNQVSNFIEFYGANTVKQKFNLVTGDITPYGNITRGTHSSGFLVGSYNSVGDNSTKTNPIYTIGSNYMPTDTSLGNMHGIGYSHSNFWGSGKSTGWGLYVVENGSIHATISSGGLWSSGNISTNNQFISSVATGTAPLTVSSTTTVSNLSADLLDGLHGTSFLRTDTSTTLSAATNTNYKGLFSINNTSSGPSVYRPAMEIHNEIGNHSYGLVANFSCGTGTTNDLASIRFTPHTNIVETNQANWSIGYVNSRIDGGSKTGSVYSFRISQNHGWSQGISTTGSWGTDRFIINTDGAVTIPGATTLNSTLTVENTINANALTVNGIAILNGGLSQDGQVILNGADTWIRTHGATGWYNATYGGGIHMEDTTWVKVYNNKNFYVNGAITATGNISGTSDRNLKENLVKITGVLDKIKKISGYKYNFIDDDNKKVYIGMMAQDWEKDFAELVETDPNGKKSLAYMNTTAVLLEAIKELDDKLEIVKNKIEWMC